LYPRCFAPQPFRAAETPGSSVYSCSSSTSPAAPFVDDLASLLAQARGCAPQPGSRAAAGWVGSVRSV